MRSTALAEARGELAKVLAEPALTEALAELADASAGTRLARAREGL